MEIKEIIMSVDFVIFLIVGTVSGLLAGLVMKGSGLIQNIAVGVVGSVISGFVFDRLNFMDVGDIADPVIAGVFGAVILIAIVWAIRGKEKPSEKNSQ